MPNFCFQYQESFQSSTGTVIDFTAGQPKVIKSETEESTSQEKAEQPPELKTKKKKKRKWSWKKKKTEEKPE